MYSHAAGFIPVHGMLHGLLTADSIDRGSMVIASKVALIPPFVGRSTLTRETVAPIRRRCFRR